jgi:hypothetical protein
VTTLAKSNLNDREESRTDNTGLAKVAVQCYADTFVVNQSLVLRINICGENRHLRQARKRYRKSYDNIANYRPYSFEQTDNKYFL